ncbi:MAG: hypothetical protein AAGG01_01485 [Planctomycetota bacterium]
MLVSLALTLAPVLTPAAAQSPDLFILARQNRIMRLTDFDGPAPELEVLLTYNNPTFFLPRGLEIDRFNGNFLVLVSGTEFSGDQGASILTIDASSGDLLNELVLPLTDVDGLEQRRDGEFFAIQGGENLLRIDPAGGSFSSIPITPPLPTGLLGMTINEAGNILVHGFNPQTPARFEINPINGILTEVPGTIPFNDMALESTGDGRLLHAGLTFGVPIRIEDLTTGEATFIPGTGPETSNIYAMRFGIGFDAESIHPVCDGSPNSTGQPATLEALGTSVLADNDLTLYSRQLPPSSFGYFLTGPNLSFQSVGAGVLCIGTPVARYSNFPLNSGTSGVVEFPIDFFSIPNVGSPVVGQTDIFQYWYRDVGGTSNLSTAQAVTLR